MNSYATPDNFKPGERWLVKDNEFSRELCEVRCLEWSPSGIRCKFEYVNSGSKNWSDTTHWYLVERLPDESKTNQAAEPARAVEDDSAFRVVFCDCILCKTVRKEHAERAELEMLSKTKQAAQDAASEEITASHKLD